MRASLRPNRRAIGRSPSVASGACASATRSWYAACRVGSRLHHRVAIPCGLAREDHRGLPAHGHAPLEILPCTLRRVARDTCVAHSHSAAASCVLGRIPARTVLCRHQKLASWPKVGPSKNKLDATLGGSARGVCSSTAEARDGGGLVRRVLAAEERTCCELLRELEGLESQLLGISLQEADVLLQSALEAGGWTWSAARRKG